MVEMKVNEMCSWVRKKAMFLMDTAEDLGMDTEGYGELAENTTSSGYTYLWLEDYGFTLYMPISCDLKKTDVYALWTNMDDGEEVEMQLKDDTTLEDLEAWVVEQEKEAQ